jgi:hypothetical protein
MVGTRRDVESVAPRSNGRRAELRERRETGTRESTGARIVGGGSVVEALVGAGVVVLAILGLLGILPMQLAAIATIGVGVALLLDGAAVAARFAQLGGVESGGSSAEMLAGVAGVTLGVLALIGLAPVTLLGIAIVVFGAALVVGGIARGQATQLVGESRERQRAAITIAEPGGGMALVGLASAVLGVLVLVGIGPEITMILAAVLALGALTMLAGSALLTRLVPAMRE